MSEQMLNKGNEDIKNHYWLSPILHTSTPLHAKIFHRYQAIRILIDFSAAFCFVAGSALFLNSNTSIIAGRLFLIGSFLFAVKPTIDLVRAFHLKRIKWYLIYWFLPWSKMESINISHAKVNFMILSSPNLESPCSK